MKTKLKYQVYPTSTTDIDAKEIVSKAAKSDYVKELINNGMLFLIEESFPGYFIQHAECGIPTGVDITFAYNNIVGTITEIDIENEEITVSLTNHIELKNEQIIHPLYCAFKEKENGNRVFSKSIIFYFGLIEKENLFY